MKTLLSTPRSWGGSLRRMARAVAKTMCGCEVAGCENRAAAFGICEDHLQQSFEAASRKVDAENHQKLVRAVRGALKTIEAEDRNSPSAKLCGGEPEASES